MIKSKPGITWVNILHLYQPPWQNSEILAKVVNESYCFIIKTLTKFPHAKATINLCASLTEQFVLYGYQNILIDLNKLAKKGQIEWLGSAKYHPILPLLNTKLITEQIRDNEAINKKYLYRYRPTGFFLPELAYSQEVARMIKKLGYQYLILDPISSAKKISSEQVYLSADTGLRIIFRQTKISRSFPPEEIHLLSQKKYSGIIVTATDGELYGHFHQDWQDHFKQVLENSNIITQTAGEWQRNAAHPQTVSLRSSNWHSTVTELKQRQPYALWHNRNNLVQQNIWRLANYAIAQLKLHSRDRNIKWADQHLQRGLSSCTFWWASGRTTSTFSPVSWNPDEIDNGLEELVRSLRSLQQASRSVKLWAEKLYTQAKMSVWSHHWKKYYDNKR